MSSLVRPSYRHVFVVITIAVSVYFGVRTSDAVIANRALARQLRDNQGAVATLVQQNAALSADLAYEQTPAYAEQVAREQLGMMKPGDHVIHVQIAPVAAGVAAPPTNPTAQPAAPVPTVATWRRWLLLFTHPSAAAAPSGSKSGANHT